jgi:hypothetical protein
MITFGGLIYTATKSYPAEGGLFIDKGGTVSLLPDVPGAALAPTARLFPTLWCDGGSRCWIWSGGAIDVGTSTFTDFGGGAMIDVSSGMWTPMPAANEPSARQSGQAVWTGSFAIVWGGQDKLGGTLATGAIYAP